MLFDEDDLEYVEKNQYNQNDVAYVFDKLNLDSVYDIDCLLEDFDIDFNMLVQYVRIGSLQCQNGRIFRNFY